MTDAVARTALDLDGLEAAAKAATPGPWRTIAEDTVDGPELMIEVAGHNYDRNADFVAAFNPAVALALVNELRALRAPVSQMVGREALLKLREDLTDILHVEDGVGEFDPLLEALNEAFNMGLQSAQQASELSAAERDALERAVQARQAELRLRGHHPDNAIQTEHWKRRDLLDVAEAIRSHAVDALLALRAREER